MIEIWSKPQCPFCDAAVQICETKDLEFKKYMLDEDFNREEFTEKFPTICDLAHASEDKVLKLWQGLGYYSRARNMQFTAQFICDNFNGVFPNKHKDILSLEWLVSEFNILLSSKHSISMILII